MVAEFCRSFARFTLWPGDEMCRVNLVKVFRAILINPDTRETRWRRTEASSQMDPPAILSYHDMAMGGMNHGHHNVGDTRADNLQDELNDPGIDLLDRLRQYARRVLQYSYIKILGKRRIR